MEGSSLTEREVNGLSDLFKAFELLKKLDIDCKGIRDIEGAKCRLLQHIQESGDQEEEVQLSACQLMQSVIDEDVAQRAAMVELYQQSSTYLALLPAGRRRELETSINKVMETFVVNLKNLQKTDCAILVAGEVSSGKSSLLNLILGEELLPTSLLSCTSVICELKYSERRYARVHNWDEARGYEILDLDDANASAKQLSGFVHQKDDRLKRFTYKRVEIFWPFQLLKGGIVIVDTPGIGESKEMTSLVKSYMTSAFAFIYVINSGNAGGLQPDRLQDLLAELCKHHDDLNVFDPRSAIFVCNKWDQVPVEEEEAVKQDILYKLRKSWQGISEEQVFYLSTTKAAQSYCTSGYITEDLSMLLLGIHALLPISLKKKLEAHNRWLSHVLRRSSFYLRVHIANETRTDEERKVLTEKLHYQLDHLEKDSKKVLENLKQEVQEKSVRACDHLLEYLMEDMTQTRVMHWEEQDCPDAPDWDLLQEKMVSRVSKRIRQEVSEWDNRYQIFSNIQLDMMQKFQQHFELMEDQLALIESDMLGRDKIASDTLSTLRAIKFNQGTNILDRLSSTQKVLIGLAMPILLPLGVIAGICAIPIAGVRAIKNKIEEAKQLKDYRLNKSRYMTSFSAEMLSAYTDRKQLEKMVRGQLLTVMSNLESMIDTVPAIIDTDRNLINKLQHERQQSESSLVEEYLPLYYECAQLRGKLDYFYCNEIRTYDIEAKHVRWTAENPPLRHGLLSNVYAITLQHRDVIRHAAIQVRHDVMTDKNASECLLEEENLRKLQHKNIVSFYGTCGYRKDEGEDGTSCSFRLMLITELIQDTLQCRITGDTAENPAKVPQAQYEQAILGTAALVQQLCEVLAYLHEKGLVYKVLHPANILLTEDHTIKLYDFTCTKPHSLASTTTTTTSTTSATTNPPTTSTTTATLPEHMYYSAPEVLENNLITTSADIYSLALIVWELWYGLLSRDYLLIDQAVSDHVDAYPMSVGDGLDYHTAIRSGKRPGYKNLGQEMPLPWQQLLNDGWSHCSDHRPTAERCSLFFQSVCKELAHLSTRISLVT